MTVRAPGRGVRIAVQPEVLVYAIRHAIGRETSAVEQVVAELIRHVDDLGAFRESLADEIADALRYGRAGRAREINEWQKALHALREVAT